MDDQWPRYEVFQQERPGQPHHNVGTVHAPDPEIALQNARDVFARRPRCHSLWVVPVTEILSRTAQELASMAHPEPEEAPEMPLGIYHLFQKTSQRATMTFVSQVGQIEAPSPYHALQQAVETYGRDSAYVWWLFPEQAVTRSQEEEIESLFAPAEDKLYRHPNQYRTVTSMQRVRRSD